MKISTLDAAKVIHEVERAIANRTPVAKGEELIPAPVWDETSSSYRDIRASEVNAYLITGVVDTIGDADIFQAIVEAVR